MVHDLACWLVASKNDWMAVTRAVTRAASLTSSSVASMVDLWVVAKVDWWADFEDWPVG